MHEGSNLWKMLSTNNGLGPRRFLLLRSIMHMKNTVLQSGSSGALLLTAANLAALRLESLHPNDKLGKPLDTMSVASSTHFTVVNGITRRTEKPLPKCCCRSHRLTALVLSMSCIISLGIFGAVFYMESKCMISKKKHLHQ